MMREPISPAGRRVLADNGRAAFSLVEILIAVIILALGVLGLGAMFPAIIRQQREGIDAVSGGIAANMARSLLLGTAWESGLPTDWKYAGSSGGLGPPSGAPPFPGFWGLVREDQNGLYPASNAVELSASIKGRWHVPQPDGFGSIWLGNASNRRPYAGVYSSYNKQPLARVPGWQRLLPSSGEGEPQYVWDVAVQLDPADARNAATSSQPPLGRIRAALFVRRVDPGIRTASDVTLRSMLHPTGGLPNPLKVPVGEGASGEATLDGTGNFAPIREAAVAFRHIPTDPIYARRDRLYIGGDMSGMNRLANAEVLAALSQIGQRVVDNLGNVYTVTGFGVQDEDKPYVTVDPPVPGSVPDPSTVPSVPPTTNLNRFRSEYICSVLFTVQVPAAVITVEIEP